MMQLLVHITINHYHIIIVINPKVRCWAALTTTRLLAGTLRETWNACTPYTSQIGTERPCIDPIWRARAQALPLSSAPLCIFNIFIPRVCRLALAFAFALG